MEGRKDELPYFEYQVTLKGPISRLASVPLQWIGSSFLHVLCTVLYILHAIELILSSIVFLKKSERKGTIVMDMHEEKGFHCNFIPLLYSLLKDGAVVWRVPELLHVLLDTPFFSLASDYIWEWKGKLRLSSFHSPHSYALPEVGRRDETRVPLSSNPIWDKVQKYLNK